MKKYIFRLLTGRFGNFIGRRNLVRAGSYLTRAGRLDVPNDMKTNGEIMVQKAIIENSSGEDIVIIDCGANIGQWTGHYVSQLSSKSDYKTKIVCFEPSEYTFRKLKKTLGSIKKKKLELILERVALSSEEGNAELAVVHDGAGTNSLVSVPDSYIKKEKIKKIKLDNYLVDNKIKKIHLLKIDAEGHDFDVIMGAKKSLLSEKIAIVQFEYNWRWIYGRHYLRDVFDLMSGSGYKIGKVTPNGIQFYPGYNVGLETFVEANYVICAEEWENKFRHVSTI